MFLGPHADHAVDQAVRQALQRTVLVRLRQRLRTRQVEQHLGRGVARVDVLSSWSGRTRETPAELGVGNDHRAAHAYGTGHAHDYPWITRPMSSGFLAHP